MKKLGLLILMLLAAAACQASPRQWRFAKVELASETNVSSKLLGDKNTVHFTIETEDKIYFADYSFKPGHGGDNHIPDLGANSLIKVSIEGRHVYLLDANGKEVKLHVVRKISKQ